MSEVRVYQHPTCSTCRKALAWLTARGVSFTSVRIAAEPPSAKELEALITRSGLPARRFFNTSGQSYREGGWSAKVDGLSVQQAAAALAADGMLIKRPLLVAGEHVLVGFKESEYQAAFGK